jgi:ribosomal protein S6--L-glutamate ligase
MRIALLSRNAALYSTSRLVLAARARGHEVDVIDPLDLQMVVARGRPNLCYAGSRLPRYDVVIPRVGSRVTRYGSGVVALFEQAGVPVLNRSQAIALARDKVSSLMLLAQHRIRVPKTVAMRGLVGVDEALELVGGCPVIVKLQQGTHGVGCMMAESPSALISLVETFGAMGQEVILQQYIPSPLGDLRVLVIDGTAVASMRRRPRPDEFRSNLHRGGEAEAMTLPRRYKTCAEKAARLAGLDVAGVDILETDDGPVVLELNSSPGLEGIEQATEVDVAGRIIAAAEARRKKKPRRRAARSEARASG